MGSRVPLSPRKLLRIPPGVEHYATAMAIVICTLAVRLALDPLFGNRAPYVFFFLAIVVTKHYCGRGAGLFATVLGGISAWYFILEPRFSLRVLNPLDVVNLGAYLVVGAIISLLGPAAKSLPRAVSIGGREIKLRVLRQTAILAGAAVVLAGMVLLLEHDFTRAHEAEGWLGHTYDVINSAQSLSTLTREAEAGQRGFLITGDARYLQQYRAALAQLPRQLEELRALTSDNASQQIRCIELARLIDTRLDLLKRGVELRQAGQTGTALAAVGGGAGEQLMKEVVAELDAVIADERRLLQTRSEDAEARASRARWILGLGSSALILLLVFASLIIERETVRREELAQALRRHSDLLEQAHDSLIACRLGGAIGYWSRGAELLYGYSREEAVGHYSHELLKTHHPLGVAEIDARVEREGEWRGELAQTTKDGRNITVEAFWTLARDEEGNKTILEANRDVTERKLAEEALRRREAELRAAQRIAKLGSWTLDLDSGCLTWSDQNAETFGSDPKLLPSTHAEFARFFTAESWARLTEAHERATKGGKGYQIDLEMVRPDGGRRWLSTLGEPEQAADGRVTRLRGTMQDITERRRAEEALRESQERLSFVVQASSLGTWDWDLVSGRLEWSPRCREIFGIPPGTPINYDRFLQAVHPDDRARIDSAVKSTLAGDEHYDVEMRTVRPDGAVCWVNARGRAYFDNTGRPIRMSGTTLDITERKAAEAERLLLSTAIEQAAETIVITDREARIVYANPAFTWNTGYSREEAYGQNPRVLKSGKQSPEFYRQMWSILSAGKLWWGEFINRRKDGTLYQEEATIAPVRDASGQITNYIAIKNDVTERRRAENALRENELILRFFVQYAPAAIAMLDTEMRYLVVSQRWMADYHLGDRDIRGLSHYEVFPEVSEEGKQVHRRCLAGAVERREEDRFPRPDGSMDWVRWEVRPWRKPDDSIGGIIIFSEVITGRKQAEEAVKSAADQLRERVEELKTVMDVAPVAIWVAHDPECREITGNRAAELFYDLSAGEGVSATASARRFFQGGRELNRHELPMQQAVARGVDIRNTELEVLLPSGARKFMFGNARPLRDTDGRVRGGIGAFVETTERKATEQALVESELRYRQLFERSESALAVYEILFDEQGRPCDFSYVNVNPAFERATGRVGAEIVGRTAREVASNLEKYWIELFGQVALTGVPATFEHYAAHLGKHFSGAVYSPRPRQVAVNFLDVTKRVLAEEEVRQLNLELEERVRARTAALEATNHELEAFTHSVSHDLRAPLRGIDGWSLALLEDYGPRLDVQAQKYLDHVRDEAQRMGRLIDDLLHLSRVGRTELVPRPVDLSALATTIVARLKEANAGRDIAFRVQPHLRAEGDAALLDIALTNLLENAAKFTGRSPHARVEFGQSECDGKSAFYVRDNGVGFDMKYAGMLFEPFQRLHKPSEFPGTGIGLATVQRVVHRHGGRVWAEGRVGGGATIYFTLGEDQA